MVYIVVFIPNYGTEFEIERVFSSREKAQEYINNKIYKDCLKILPMEVE